MRIVARWCVTHRLVVVGLWLAVLAATFLGSSATGSNYATSTTLSGTPSAAAAQLLQQAVPGQSGDTEQIVFQAKTGTVDNPAVQAQITTMLGQVSHLPYVSSVTSPYTPAGVKQVGAAKTVAFATVNFAVDANSIPAAEATTFVNTARSPNSPDLQVDVVGDVAASTNPSSSPSTYIGVGAALVVLFGALKMKKLENHGLAMAASILAIVPCITPCPCCCFGIPIGIWALIVLCKPEVKSYFT